MYLNTLARTTLVAVLTNAAFVSIPLYTGGNAGVSLVFGPRVVALSVVPPGPLAEVNIESRRAEANRLLEQGTQQYRTNQMSAALQSLQQALAIFQEINDQPRQIKTLRNLGNVHYLMARFEPAIAFYQQSLNLARQITDREGEAAALSNLGVIAVNQGNYRQADEYYQQALPIYRQIKDRLGEGQVLGNLAEIATFKGDYAGAIANLQQAIAVARELGDRQLESNSIGMLGVVYHTMNNYPEAIKYHQQHLALARQLQDQRSEAAALNNLGNEYYQLGDYGQAITYHEQRLQLARSIGDRLGEAYSLKNLSIIYYELGNFPKSLETAFASLTIARELNNLPLETSLLTTMGNLYEVVQDYPNAIASHQRRFALAEESGDASSAATALINLGTVYKSMGQYPQAIATHEKALKFARQINDQAQISTVLVNLGAFYDDLKQYDKAISHHQQALAIARTIKDLASEGLILNNLGNTFFHNGQLGEAKTTLLRGVQVWESLRGSLGNNDLNKVSIFEQQTRTYRLLQRVLVAQNQTDAALEIAERGRARAFVELLARRLQTGKKLPADPNVFPTIAQMQEIAKAQNSTLVQYSITYEDVLEKGKMVGRETELYIWAIAPTGNVTFRKVDLKPLWQQQQTSLRELVAMERENIGVRGRGVGVVSHASNREAGAASSARLYQLLIAPIAAALPIDPVARVTFIPQGPLFLVPFAALQAPTGQYLVERHTILTAPSIQVLALTRQQRRRQVGSDRAMASRSPALVVGNPTMPTLPPRWDQPAEPLTPLPGAEAEAIAIAPLLGTQALTGDRATKVAIVQQMPQVQRIHLATHGLLDDFKGLGIPGAVALAPSANDNGLLTADEILDLQLNAELVVLSACDTGRGRITGDGVIGLSRSFISAGVPSLIVSLWAVPDSPTATLMTEFYQMLKRQPDKAQALRQAMLATMRQYPDPQDWAAFTLIGEAE